MRRVLFLGALLLAVSVLGFFARRYRANAWVTPYDLVDRTVEENAAEGRAAGFSPVDVDGLRALLRAPVEGHDWLIYWGGNTSTYFKEAVAAVSGYALGEAVGVLIVAPPGFDSPGTPSPERTIPDAVAAREWLRRRDPAARVVVSAFSMGNYSAVAAVDDRVVGAVLVGAAMAFETGPRDRLVRFREPVCYRFPPAPPRVRALVIQAEHDEPGQGEAVSTWLGAPLVVVPGIGHEVSATHPVTVKAAREFLLEALRSGK